MHAAVDAVQFQPAAANEVTQRRGRITVVALSRLVYRKGIDLLAAVIPAICQRHPHVDFVIGDFPSSHMFVISINSNPKTNSSCHLDVPCSLASECSKIERHVSESAQAHNQTLLVV